MAYSGADLAAVVSFHGALPVPDAEQAKSIKAKILICHGALDSLIPDATIQKVRAALEGANADYQIVYYAGARHSFTVPGAEKHGLDVIRYNAAADQRSWRHMQTLFNEAFGAAK
jgi:dienelactone hydrolase